MSWRDARGVLADVLPKDLKSEEILWCQRNEWSYDDYRAMKRVGVDPRDYESPLAAMRDALLSDEAREAGAKAVMKLDWNTGEVAFHPTPNDVARVVLKAAIEALSEPKEVAG